MSTPTADVPGTTPVEPATNLPIVVGIETYPETGVHATAAELIGAAGSIGTVIAVAATAPGTAAEVSRELAALGAAQHIIFEDDAATAQLGAGLTAAMAQAVAVHQPAAVLLANTTVSTAVAGRVAVRVGGAVSADAVGLRFADGEVVAQHSVFGGNYETESTVEGGPRVMTLRQGSFNHRLAPVASAELTQWGPQDLHGGSPHPGQGDQESGHPVSGATIRSIRPVVNTSGRPDLRAANTVIAGGRGLGSEQGFELAEQLADQLGGAVGATRDAVDEGYAPAHAQIGQTGVSVAPELYIGVGISGAIQHRTGMQTAKSVVAINSDEDAPIFEFADFGVVGDAFTVVPRLLDELRARTP